MDNLTTEQRRKNMQNIRSKGTTPEKIFAHELRKKKIYFSSHVKGLPGKPDFVFRRKKIAVFIDSDFWHGHPKRFIMPKTNYNYWKEKIQKNKERDRISNKELKKIGWKVLRFWEYDVKKNTEKCLSKLRKVI